MTSATRPAAVGEQFEVVRVRTPLPRQHQERKGDENPCRQSSLGGERADLTSDPSTLANRGADAVEDLREVAAGVAVDVDRRHHPLEVLAAHSTSEGGHRVGQVATQPNLGEHVGELAASGFLGVLGDRLQGLGEAETAAQRGGHQLQHLGELVGERRLTLRFGLADVEPDAPGRRRSRRAGRGAVLPASGRRARRPRRRGRPWRRTRPASSRCRQLPTRCRDRRACRSARGLPRSPTPSASRCRTCSAACRCRAAPC